MERKPVIREHLSRVFECAPGISRILLMPSRVWIAGQHYRNTFKSLLKWTILARETTNFTYDITERNKEYLAWFLANVTGEEKALAAAYIRELEEDNGLRTFLIDSIRKSSFRYKADPDPRYGRRAGWYALVRMRKPRVVVETGTDKRLGSIVMAAALARNADEGYPGRLYTIDINPRAGWLLTNPYTRYAEFLAGDSLEVLAALEEAIDVFVNDSDHSSCHESAEYAIVESRLSPDGIIIGDNSHCTTSLLEFAERTHRKFLFFREEPKDYWYPGAGIGAAYR